MFNKKEECHHLVCDDCGHMFVDKGQVVIKECGIDFKIELNYCSLHKKPYDYVYEWGFSYQYYKKMEVDEDGVPIGYKKIK